MHVRCPHCHQPVELVENAGLEHRQRGHLVTLATCEEADISAFDTSRWLIADMAGRGLGIIESKQQNRHVTLRMAE